MLNFQNNYIQELRDYDKKLKAAYEIIEKSEIVVFEWSIGPGIPVKFVTENISKYGYTAQDFYSGKVDYWDFLHIDDVVRTRDAVYEKRIFGFVCRFVKTKSCLPKDLSSSSFIYIIP